MKKLICYVLMLVVLTVSFVSADVVRDDTLGNPVLNTEDLAFISRYAAALQLFPNTIFAGFNGTAKYQYYGITYKASDILGIGFAYQTVPDTELQWFDDAGGKLAPYVVTPFSKTMSKVADVVYGAKLGELLFGASFQTYFYDSVFPLKTISYDINTGKAYSWKGYDGFKTTLNPSILLSIGDLKIAAAVNSKLNFTKYSITVTNSKVFNLYMTPNLFENIGFSVLAAKDVNDSTTLGLEVGLNVNDNGYSFQNIKNGVKIFKTNVYVDSSFSGRLRIGSKIKATESVTFFLDLGTFLITGETAHLKGTPKTDYSITTVWNVPSVNLGSEFEILKNLNIRLSAQPSYMVINTRPAKIKGSTLISVDSTTFVGAFSVTSSVGLGYKIGAFSINWELDNLFLDRVLRRPLTFVNINGTGPNLASRVQVNYSF